METKCDRCGGWWRYNDDAHLCAVRDERDRLRDGLTRLYLDPSLPLSPRVFEIVLEALDGGPGRSGDADA